VNGTPSHVVLIGLDGADWRLLMPLIDRGVMPSLQRIIEGGMSGRVAAPAIMQQDVSWACALTGVHAHMHGVLNGQALSDDGCSVRPSACSDRRAPVAWEVAEGAGIACIALGWGGAIGVDTSVLSVATAQGGSSGRTLADDVAGRLAGGMDPRDRPLLDRLCELLSESEGTAHHAMSVMRTRSWRLAAVRFKALGEILNDYARFVAPAPVWVLPRRASAFANAIEEACRAHDEWIGMLLEAAGGTDVAAVVASPCGTPLEILRTDPSRARSIHLSSRPSGIVAISGPGVRHDTLAFGIAAIDLCPTVLALMECPCPQEVQGQPIAALESGSGVASRAVDSSDRHAMLQPLQHAAVMQSCRLPRHPRVNLSEDAMAVDTRRRFALADSLADAGLHVMAAEVMRELVDGRPEDARAVLRLVELLRESGQVESASERLEACIACPEHLLPLRALLEASLHAAQERHSDALDVLQREQRRQEVAGEAAGEAALHIACARSQLALGCLEDAERSCERALESDPGHRSAHVMHAQVLYAAERYSGTMEAGRRALALAYFDPQTHLLVGTALAALGRAHEAVAQLRIAVEQDPGLVAAYRRLAAVHLRQLGDVNAARAYAARAAEARAAIVRGRGSG
jgi:tetratricopeptide (TPR) repeat protein